MLSTAEFLDTSPTIEEVDKKILDLRKEIRVLEQYRNARLLVVSRLPLEVLSTIFEYMALEKLDSSWVHTRRTYSWLAATQVCHLWRNTALNNPRMWECIYSHTNQDLAKLFLERAKSAPIYLRSSPFGGRRIVTPLILEHSAQLKELDLGYYTAQLNGLSRYRFPLLETFKAGLSSSSTLYDRKFTFTSDDRTLACPPLRHVVLMNCHIDLQARCLAQVVVLNITYESSVVDMPNVPIVDVIAAMDKMKCLTCLTLMNVIGTSGNVAEGAVAQIPRLKTLRIEAKHVDSLSILAHIACPCIESVIASLTEPPPLSDPLVASMVRSFCSLVPGSPMDWKITLHVQTIQEISQNTMAIVPDPSVHDDNQSPPFRLIMLGPSDFSTCLHISSLLPATRPFTLDLRRSRHMSIELLHTFLRSLPKVEELLIDDLETLVEILKDTPTKGKGKRNDLPPFSLPSVKHLQLSQTTRIKHKHRNLKEFKKFLAARKALGVEVEVFQLCSTGHILVEDELDLFRAEVGAIEMVPSTTGEISRASLLP